MTYGYDENGNQTLRQAQGGPADTFQYDHENRLTQAVIEAGTTTYDYNGDGLRLRRTVDGVPIDYAWHVGSALPVILQETAGGGTIYYVYGLDLISEIGGGGAGNAEYYLYDGLGSTTELANSGGGVTGTYTYDVFGSVRTRTGMDTEWSYTGEQNDPNGLVHLRARYYDPAIGRFVSQDPFAGFAMTPQSLNRYPYVVSNPVNLTDPSGLQCGLTRPWECGGGIPIPIWPVPVDMPDIPLEFNPNVVENWGDWWDWIRASKKEPKPVYQPYPKEDMVQP